MQKSMLSKKTVWLKAGNLSTTGQKNAAAGELKNRPSERMYAMWQAMNK